MIRFFLLLVALSMFYQSLAQKIENDSRDALRIMIEERIEFMSTNQIEAEVDFQNLFETLEYYFHHPLDINRSSSEELKQLGILNEIQINHLIHHREKNGDLLALEELQSIESFDLQSIRMLKPFCKVSSTDHIPNPRFSTLLKESKTDLILRSSRIIEKGKGYRDTDGPRYLGDPFNHYSRFRFQYYNRISAGFTAEKDAGERFFSGEQKRGFDFYSAHIFLNNYKRFKQIALGDFQAQFGQGLTFWSGLAFGSGLGISGLKRAPKGLTPYTSAQEDLFLRGLGSSIAFQKLTLTTFYSYRKIDARIEEGSNLLSSFYGNGLHRTKSELEKKGNTSEQIIGAHLTFKSKATEVGITAVQRELGAEIEAPDQLYRRFDSPQKEQFNLGLDYSFFIKNILFFGELSSSQNKAIAFLSGCLWMPAKGLGVAILQRHYSKEYTNIQSNALGRNSRNSNESGTYLNTEWTISKRLSLSTNLNLFTTQWLSYQKDAPTKGKEHNLQLNYFHSKRSTIYFRYRIKNEESNDRTDHFGVSRINDEVQRSYRLHFAYQLNDHWKIQNRLEWKNLHSVSESDHGFLIFQDLQYDSKKLPLKVSVRYAMFQTSNYRTRIYAYESDVLYAFSIPPYHGIGNRFYVLLKWKIKKGIDFWIRYAQTAYLDRESIGSGLDEIQGSKRTQIRSQLRFSF